MTTLHVTSGFLFFIGLAIIASVNSAPQNYLREAVKRLTTFPSIQSYKKRATAVPEIGVKNLDKAHDQSRELLTKRHKWSVFTGTYGKRGSLSELGDQYWAPADGQSGLVNREEAEKVAHQIFDIMDLDKDGVIEDYEVQALDRILDSLLLRAAQNDMESSFDVNEHK